MLVKEAGSLNKYRFIILGSSVVTMRKASFYILPFRIVIVFNYSVNRVLFPPLKAFIKVNQSLVKVIPILVTEPI